VLRRIFGPKREEDGSWRKLHNDELHSLYSSPNIVRGEEVFTESWLRGPKGRDHWEDLGVDGRITLR